MGRAVNMRPVGRSAAGFEVQLRSASLNMAWACKACHGCGSLKTIRARLPLAACGV